MDPPWPGGTVALEWPPAWPPYRSARMTRAIHEILQSTTRTAPGGFRGVINDPRFTRVMDLMRYGLFPPAHSSDLPGAAEIGPVWECQHIHRTVEDAAECSAQAIEQLVAVAP